MDKIDALIQLEVDKGIPEDKIVLGGFSQGGAIAALSLLLKNRNLAGYVALSTWIPMPEKVAETARPNAKDFPVFWGHGTDDQVVRYECESPAETPASAQRRRSLTAPRARARSASVPRQQGHAS